MKTKISLTIVMLIFFISGCKKGANTTGIDPDPDPGPRPDPPEEMVSVPVGMPALFIETSEDASVFNDVIGEFIEGSQQNFIQFVPETGEAALIATNTSRSFAQSISFIKAFDDGLYLLNVSETGAGVSKFNTDALLDTPESVPVPTPRQFDSISEKCFVVLGNDLYYKVAWREAPFPGTGFADGPLVQVSNFFTGGLSVTELIAGIGGDSPSSGGFVTDACYFNMDIAEGIWYDYQKEDVAESGFTNTTFTTYTRNIPTGEPAAEPGELVLGVADESRNLVKWSNIAYDNGFGFIALLNIDSQGFGILQFDPSVSPVALTVVLEEVLTGVNASGIHSLDVDDGYVSFVITTPNTGEDLAALFNPNTSTFQTFDFGVAINQLQLIYRVN